LIGLRLTIGIPTRGGRIELLATAIDSALAQQTPARVLVCNQGSEAVAELVSAYADNPLVRMVHSPAENLWQNWAFAAESCDTELFAWLQDDDVVAPHFTKRIQQCFDAVPDAQTYLARLGVSYDGKTSIPGHGTGPTLPMDLFRGRPTTMAPVLMAAGAYYTSHALSPAVAFRVNPKAIECVRNVPQNADLFAERIILAELARLGGAVIDPAIVGYWVHHEGNESTRQNRANDGPRQYRVMCEHIDPIVSDFRNWRETLRSFAHMAGHQVASQWLTHASQFRADSANVEQACQIVETLYPGIAAKPEAQAASERQATPETATNRRARRAEKAVSRS